MSIYDIIQELNQENGTNYKMGVLRKYADNETLKQVLKMAYDKVAFTYGISMKNAKWPVTFGHGGLEPALAVLCDRFATREWTGNDALEQLNWMFSNLTKENAIVLRGIINRDLRINMGRRNINKVFKDLIVKPVYMRCGLFNDDTRGKINPKGAYVQLKADGTYREFTVENGEVLCNSRSGEVYEYPVLNDILRTYPDGHYIGELTVVIDGVTQDRATGNGMINSDEPPHDNIVLDLWDYVTLEEYTNAANKIKGKTPYHARLAQLVKIIGEELSPTLCPIRLIETYEVQTVAEALQHCARWMEMGLEGAIYKDRDAIFRDGTNPQQLKLKLEIDADVRITGFKPGTVGTKREGKIGSIEYATDDGRVRGYASGFTDAELDDMDGRREQLLGQVMTLTCSDITRGRNNEHYALSHPRFVELRSDKTETDTLERIFEAKRMAMCVDEGTK
jgi:hypothetical protein